jgi:hypothetical protein
MATNGDSSASASAQAALTAATAAQRRDDAISAAKRLEAEAAVARAANDARAEQLQAKVALLQSAADAQERVRAAAATLSKEPAQADALEVQAAAIRERLHLEAARDDEPEDGDTDSISSEAAAVTHLHSQAYAVQNIKNLIPIVLDLKSFHYSKWRGYHLLALGRYSLKDHVLSDESCSSDPAWNRMDCVVVSWIFTTISTELLDIIHAHDGAAPRCGISQSQPGRSFCRKMKGMADSLADLGEPVSDRTLVLNVLRGLNERFQFMVQLITRQKPFPSFGDVRADLRLADLNMGQSSGTPTAFLASSSSKSPPAAPAPSPAPPKLPTTPSFGGSHSGSGSGAGRGRRRRGGRNQGTLGGQQWPSLYNPWSRSIHMWPGPTAGGPRPSPARASVPHHQQQHAMMAATPSPGYLAPGSYSSALLPAPTQP